MSRFAVQRCTCWSCRKAFTTHKLGPSVWSGPPKARCPECGEWQPRYLPRSSPDRLPDLTVLEGDWTLWPARAYAVTITEAATEGGPR